MELESPVNFANDAENLAFARGVMEKVDAAKRSAKCRDDMLWAMETAIHLYKTNQANDIVWWTKFFYDTVRNAS